MLLILNAPRLRPNDIEQFYCIWRVSIAFNSPLPIYPHSLIVMSLGRCRAIYGIGFPNTIS